MKTKSYFLAMLACAAMVGCSNNDEIENNVAESTLDGNGYMTVRLAMTGNTGSRAWDGVFEDASEAEKAVENATFYFFDANGNGCADPCTIQGSALNWTEQTVDGNVDTASDPVVILRNVVNTPAQLLCVLNATAGLTGQPSLNQVKAVVGSYTQEKNFVMSSSVYGEDASTVAISSSNIADTEEGAKADGVPVTVYVERVLAKVSLEVATSADITSGTTDVELEPEVVGWWLDCTNPDSYLVKSLPAGTVTSGDWWNDATNHRSYWAVSATPTAYTHYAQKDQKTVGTGIYCQENTTNVADSLTKAVVAVQWKVKGAEGAAATVSSLVRFRSKLYTEANFLSVIANEAFSYYRIQTENADGTKTLSTILPQLSLKGDTEQGGDIKDYQATIVVTAPETGTLVELKTNAQGQQEAQEVTGGATAVQAAIADVIPGVNYWYNGIGYYFTDINHYSTSATDETSGETTTTVVNKGIVRNHLYKLNVTGISGLGTPVPSTDIIIVPTEPVDEPESYLAAEINILNYKVVPTQEVEFDTK